MTDSRSLHQAVGLLLKRPTKRIDVGPAHYTVRAPCLLQQLADAVAASSCGTGGRTTPGSKSPLNTDALDLWWEIAFSVASWAEVLHIDRARYRPSAVQDGLPVPEVPLAAVRAQAGKRGRKTGRSDADAVPPVGLLLRAVAARAPERPPLAEAVERNIRRWADRIEKMLAPDPTASRNLPGIACPHCGVTWVVALPDPPDPDHPWVPSTPDPERPKTCRVCHGDDSRLCRECYLRRQNRTPALWLERGDTGVIRCLWCRNCEGYLWRDDLASMAQHDDDQEPNGDGQAVIDRPNEANAEAA